MLQKTSAAAILVLALAALLPAADSAPDAVKALTDPGVITTRQQLTPAGIQSLFQGRVYGAVFDRDPALVWVLTSKELATLDWKSNRVVRRIPLPGTPGLQGLRYDTERARLLYTVATRSKTRKPPQPGWKYRTEGTDVQVFATGGDASKLVAANIGTELNGALDLVGHIAAVPLVRDNKIAVVDLDGRGPVKYFDTAIAPFAVLLSKDGKTAWVSNWGGRKARARERTAPSGYSETADRVLVDNRGIGSSGVVVRIDLATGEITNTVEVGLHPTSMAWDREQGRLYVATTNQDAVAVVDTARARLDGRIKIKPFGQDVKGIAPTAVALSPDGSRLYVACGGINAIAVVDTRTQAIAGMIPTAWYPDAVTISPDGRTLVVSALLGYGSGWRDDPRQRYVHALRGSIAIVPVPSPAQLANYTSAVAENNRAVMLAANSTPALAAAPLVVPLRSGDPSKIEHVLFIIKENRTYDQVFGDLPEGNGDPSLELFGEDIAPNHRRLARQFTLFDNFYATGGDSADGHQWITQAAETSYVMLPGYRGRSYPAQGNDPIAYAASGFLWDAALKMHKTVRVYGEFAGHMTETEVARVSLLQRWKNGEDLTHLWNVTAPIAPLNAILAHNFPTAAGGIPDQVRAEVFLKDQRQWESSGEMPNLIYLDLPSDHTLGAYPGTSSVKAMVADNDLALGRIVEAVTHSRFWKTTAIMVVEDDAQSGVDHVDGHRTVALAISPYTRRGYVDSTFYSQPSMMKTIELMLGIPQLTLFDRIATDMRAAFQDQADLTPYDSVTPQQSLYELNPSLKATSGEQRRAAVASMRWRWDIPDAAPSALLNRIIWHEVRGWGSPYPATRRAALNLIGFGPDEGDGDDRR